MTIGQAVVWASQNVDPKHINPELTISEPYVAGLPVGGQVVGRYRDDFGVLQFAHAFEAATGAWKRRPGA